MHTVAPRLYSISVNAVAKQSLSMCTSNTKDPANYHTSYI